MQRDRAGLPIGVNISIPLSRLHALWRDLEASDRTNTANCEGFRTSLVATMRGSP